VPARQAVARGPVPRAEEAAVLEHDHQLHRNRAVSRCARGRVLVAHQEAAHYPLVRVASARVVRRGRSRSPTKSLIASSESDDRAIETRCQSTRHGKKATRP
jgi:hypothetical protein